MLSALDPDRPEPQRELAARLEYDQSNLAGVIDKLEARGAVRRRPDERDRRVKLVVLTPDGAELRQRFRASLQSEAGPLAHLDAAAVRTLRDQLRAALRD